VESDQLSAGQRFVSDLSELRQRAGRPSYSTLERLSGHRLRRATMSDVLNGNRVNLPDWRFVADFVAACRAAAKESGLDGNELGTIADWKRHWDGAFSGVIDARFPGRGHQSFTRKEQGASPHAEPLARSARSVWGAVPPRLRDFVGREAWLDTLRQALAKDDRAGVVVIQGLLGVGKTQLAIEFAHRYAREYDLVWWVPCVNRESACDAMADLAARVGHAAGSARGRGDTELFDVLRRGERYARWLLVFDNANEPDEIRDLIPPASGDVLVTTRNSRWEATGDMLELDAFDRAESIEFLRGRMRTFDASSAHRLAEGVGDLPLLLEHAVESSAAVDAYLARLAGDPLGLLDEQSADYQATIAGEWRTALDQLRADVPDALDLLCCLAFFGSDPVPRESLERGSYIEEVSIHAMLREPLRLTRAVMRLRRAGLLRVGAGTGNLAVHRATRCVVRDMVANSGAAATERARHDVHLLLAAADPLDPEDPTTWRNYDELRGHAAESDMMSCSHETVRRLVVNLVRFLNAVGEPRAAVNLADEALAHWDTVGAGDGATAPGSHVALRIAKAEALFACGRFAEAFQFGVAGMSGARFRIMGKFAEARAADQESLRAHIAEFGDGHPRTTIAVNSLIADLVLSGSGAEAALAADRVYRDSLAFYSDPLHPAVLAGRNAFGRCLWLSGRYGEAVSVLADVHAAYGALADGGTLDEDHPWRLMHEIDYTVARRDKGLIAEESQVLADDMHDVRRRCWRALGADHPQTLAATVVRAGILRRVSGQARQAVSLLEDAERRYQSALPDHPYGHACTAFLAAVRCQAAADGPEETARSVVVIQDVLKRLTDSVGEDHPLSLIAVGTLVNALARAGDLDAALKRGRDALAGFQARLGSGHPQALAFEVNIATIRSRLGHEPSSAELRARYADALGVSHPDLALFGQGRLIDIDFTPLPL
jgi:NB-ARC domain/Tetratricopeptide repeat